MAQCVVVNSSSSSSSFGEGQGVVHLHSLCAWRALNGDCSVDVSSCRMIVALSRFTALTGGVDVLRSHTLLWAIVYTGWSTGALYQQM